MTHADSLALPDANLAKPAFYQHVAEALAALLTPPTPDSLESNPITTLSNAASLLFGSYENYELNFGRDQGRRINWAGFYLLPSLLSRSPAASVTPPTTLLLGPYHGRPACSSVSLLSRPSRPVGVCAAGFLDRDTVVVPDVEARPGHIFCDGQTKSEVVVPIIVKRRREDGEEEDVVVGVLDVDCEAVGAFDDEDRVGLELFVETLNKVVRWEL